MDGDFRDDYVERLQTTVHKIKSDRDMGERHMVFERLLKDEYKAGKAEGRAEGKAEGRAEGKAEGQNGFVMYFLAKLGEVPYDLKQTLSEITEEDRLYELGSIAANATSIEEFIQKSNIKS